MQDYEEDLLDYLGEEYEDESWEDDAEELQFAVNIFPWRQLKQLGSFLNHASKSSECFAQFTISTAKLSILS